MANDVNVAVRKVKDGLEVQSFLASTLAYRKASTQEHDIPSKTTLYADAILLLEFLRDLNPLDEIEDKRRQMMMALVHAVIDDYSLAEQCSRVGDE